jgi:hypothetical protein
MAHQKSSVYLASWVGFEPATNRSPFGHCSRPFDRMDADIGATVDRHDAGTMNSATGFDQLQREFNLDRKRHPLRAAGSLPPTPAWGPLMR